MEPTQLPARTSPCAYAAHDQHLHARRTDDPAELITRVKTALPRLRRDSRITIASSSFLYESYRIQGGNLGVPIKGATLIGGADVLTRPNGIGTDMALDESRMCGQGGHRTVRRLPATLLITANGWWNGA